MGLSVAADNAFQKKLHFAFPAGKKTF